MSNEELKIYARAGEKLRMLRQGTLIGKRALQLALILWGAWLLQKTSVGTGEPRWALHWETNRVLPSVFSSALIWVAAALVFRLERSLKRRAQQLEIQIIQETGSGDLKRAQETDVQHHWLMAAAWIVQSFRQACTLAGALELTQLARPEQLLSDPFAAKALLLGVIVWQALSAVLHWTFASADA